MHIVNKAYLRENAREILERGPLDQATIQSFLAGGTPGAADESSPADAEATAPRIIVQVSSGSTGAPLRIPRSPRDVGDIAARVIGAVVKRTGVIPERIAMIGGISHLEAAGKLKLGQSDLRSFDSDAVDELCAWDPVALSCYPSVLRELIAGLPESMPSLRIIKLGGEKIFAADLAKIFARFPEVVVVEQLGSTEVPAVAVRVITAEDRRPPYDLQTARFRFQMPSGDGWFPLIVKDEFDDLLFPVNEFYETGDELLFENGAAVDVRRIGDPAAAFYETAETLLALPGCINVQFLPDEKRILYAGSGLPARVSVNGVEFAVSNTAPARIPVSLKLPLVVS